MFILSGLNADIWDMIVNSGNENVFHTWIWKHFLVVYNSESRIVFKTIPVFIISESIHLILEPTP